MNGIHAELIDLIKGGPQRSDLEVMRKRAREGRAISDALDLLNKIVEGPGKHNRIDGWQHEAARIINEYFDESNPCPVFQCLACQAQAQDDADDLHGSYR